MGSKVISTILNLRDNFSKTINNTTKNVKGFQDQIKHAQNSIGSFSSVMGKLKAASAVLAGGFGLVKFTENAINAGDNAYRLSQKLHVSTAEAGAMNKILSITNTDSKPLISTMTRLDKAIGSAGEKGNATTKMLEKYGIALQDSHGKLLPIPSQLDKLAEGYKKASEAGEEEAFTADVLGNKGAELIPLLENYTEAKEAAAKIKGIGVDPQQAHQTAEELKVLKMQVGATAGVMAKSFIPLIQLMLPPIITVFQKVTDIIKGNKAVLDNFIKSSITNVKNILAAISPTLSVLGNGISRFAKAFNFKGIFNGMFTIDKGKTGSIVSIINTIISAVNRLVNFATTHVELVKAVFIGLGTSIAGIKVATEIFKIIDSINKVKNVMAGLTGMQKIGGIFSKIFGLPPQALILIAVITAIAVAAYLIYKHWGQISTFFKNVWEGIKNTFNNFWNWLKSFFSKWGTVILAVVAPFLGIPLFIIQHWEAIKVRLLAVWNWIKVTISNVLSTVWKNIVTAITSNPIFKIFEAIFKGILAIAILVFVAIKTTIVNAWNSIVTTVTSVLSSLWTAISTRFMAIYNYIKTIVMAWYYAIMIYWTQIKEYVSNIVMGIWNSIVQWFTAIYNSISQSVSNTWNSVVEVWNRIKESVSNVVSSIWQSICDGFNNAKAGAVGIFEEMKASVLSVFDGVWESVKGIINKGINLINGFIGNVNNVIDKSNKVSGLNIGHVSTIPALANGGITTGPTLAMIGEGKEQEAVLPLSKLNNIINTGRVDGKGSKNNDKVVVYVTVQGNVIGNEQFADQVGEHVYKKVKLVLDNM